MVNVSATNISSRICACSMRMWKVLTGMKSHGWCCILIRKMNLTAPGGRSRAIYRAKWMTEHGTGSRYAAARPLKATLLRRTTEGRERAKAAQ